MQINGRTRPRLRGRSISSDAAVLFFFLAFVLRATSGGPSSDEAHVLRHHSRRAITVDPRYVGFHFTAEPESVVVQADSRVLLHCRHSTTPPKTNGYLENRIEWRKDGAPLRGVRQAGRILVLSNGSLAIENVASADEGKYQCVVHVTTLQENVKTTWTFLSRRATLQLASLSEFEIQPENRSVYKGDSVVFQCVVDSQPTAAVEWFHNDRPLKMHEGISILPVSSTLEISDAQFQHKGSYHCVARNGDSSKKSQVATLEVAEDTRMAVSEPPRFVIEPQSRVVVEGQAVILECVANGWPKTNVKWLKDSSTVELGSDRIRKAGSSSLLILNVNLSDSGVYTCRASNGEESVDSSATLFVKQAPVISVKPVDEVSQETNDVEMQCEAKGVPAPIVSWYKNGEMLTSSEYFVIQNNRLNILGLVRDDQGVYECIAENDVGSAQGFAQLLVDKADTSSTETAAGLIGEPSLPSEPLGLTVVSAGSRTVNLQWDAPLKRHGNLLVYHIFFREEGSSRERTLNSSVSSVTLAHLQPDTIYLVRVAAESEMGMGKSTEEMHVRTTKEQAVPGRVQNLRAKVLSPEAIAVDWDPPSATGPEAVRYKLFYIPKQADANEKETQVLMLKTSYVLHGMEKDTEYEVRVEAEGANGAGLSSEVLTVRTLSDAPSGPPTGVRAEAVDMSSVQLRWEPPALEHRNGKITGYRLKYKTKLRGSKGNTLVVDGDIKDHTITNLDPGTSYMLRIAAVNQNGTGPYTDWIRVDTPLEEKEENQIAGAPLELRVQPGFDSIHLTWLPPRDDDIMIRGYQVGWGINVPDVELVQVGSSLRQYTITGLKPNRDYVISLRAFNRIGNGFPIYETVRTTNFGQRLTPGGGPFKNAKETTKNKHNMTPIGVRAESVSSNSIRVSWTDPNEDEHALLFNVPLFTIRYSSSSDGGGQQRYMNTSEPEHVVDGLRPNTQYEFAVRIIGSTQWSMAAVNRTQPAAPSSAPRDLTIIPTQDPNTIILNWQPPKYANGEVEEYLIYYTDRADTPDSNWLVDSVKGDRLSIQVTKLVPKTAYYFKVQARNVKGYGPLSSVSSYTPPGMGGYRTGGMGGTVGHKNGASFSFNLDLIKTNMLYVIIGLVVFIIILLSVIVACICLCRSKDSEKRRQQGYMQGRTLGGRNGKTPSGTGPDLWIRNGEGVRAGDYVESPECALSELKRLTQQHPVDSPPPRYQTLQESTSSSASKPRSFPHRVVGFREPPDEDAASTTTTLMTRSSLDSSTVVPPPPPRSILVGKANPILMTQSATAYPSEAESNGTLSRSYHQSSTSLESRQRTPQVIYTGNSRQPIAKIDFSDHGSSTYGSQTALQSGTPPPPTQLPPQPPTIEGYRTIRVPGSSSGLKSFTNMPSMQSPSHQLPIEKTAHIVRPVVVASPTNRDGKVPSVMMSHKSSENLPIGRAKAQPRVNVSSIYSPYSVACIQNTADVVDGKMSACSDAASELTPLQPSHSIEELHAQMENLDTMIDDLQALQHEFNTVN
uniref:Down syndrome cell adhesion molecule-like protein Dscam2 n=1 Tax=Steinernema glaseri TaxID=37863 RepID=A0A1I7ZQQ0_9BILA